ncbi:hypothetical protein YPPY09_2800, partial [Yersinia pestis PY-09]
MNPSYKAGSGFLLSGAEFYQSSS